MVRQAHHRNANRGRKDNMITGLIIGLAYIGIGMGTAAWFSGKAKTAPIHLVAGALWPIILMASLALKILRAIFGE